MPLSALRQAPPALQNAVLQSQPGSVRVVSQGGAHTLVLYVAKDTAGQKDLSMPEVKTAIGNALKQRKEQLLRAAYLAAIHNDAVVVNHRRQARGRRRRQAAGEPRAGRAGDEQAVARSVAPSPFGAPAPTAIAAARYPRRACRRRCRGV